MGNGYYASQADLEADGFTIDPSDFIDTHRPPLAPTPPRFAVTDPYYDDIGSILTSMGYEFDEIQDSQLADYNFIKNYDAIFINCSGDSATNAPAAKDSLRQYVQNGGALYTSDWAFIYLTTSFPGYLYFLQPNPYVGVGNQYVTATITDPGLRLYLLQETVDIFYNLGAWVAMDDVGPNTDVIMRGDIQVWTGTETRQPGPIYQGSSSKPLRRSPSPVTAQGIQTLLNKPLAASFEYGDGFVIYTTFHNEPQLTELQQKLLEYFIIKPITAKIAKWLGDKLDSLNYLIKQKIINIINKAAKKSFSYVVDKIKDIIIALGFEGSRFRVSVYRPDGSLYTQIESETSPIIIEIPEAEPGEWTYTVEALDVPYDNYPFVLMVGEKDISWFEYSNLQVSPTEVLPGEEVTATATVRNVGGLRGTESVELKVDDEVRDTQDVTLNLGESQVVEFTFSFSADEIGVHDVAINGLEPVMVTVRNRLPTANAGPDQSVTEGRWAKLDGSRSSDPDGDPLTYEWEIVYGPCWTMGLSDPDTARPSFRASCEGDYKIKLTVDDGRGGRDSDEVSVTVEPSCLPPVADAGDNREVTIGDTVQLDGSGSYDPNYRGSIVYLWEFIFKPKASTATLSDRHTQKPTFVADKPGNYRVMLTARLNLGMCGYGTDSLDITANGPPPVGANIKLPQDVDRDGLFEDVNGNGRLDFDDAVTLALYIDTQPITAYRRFYDFNHNDRVDFDDAVMLAFKVGGQAAVQELLQMFEVRELKLSTVTATPNPVTTTTTTVRFTAQGQGIASIKLDIFDLSGRQVSSHSAIGETLEWNLTDQAGQVVANGIYLYIVVVRGFNDEIIRSQVKKLVVLR